MATPVLPSRLRLFLTFCILSLAHATAPGQGVTGDLQFTVSDSLGDPVQGVQVAVTGVELQGTRGTTSDAQGRCQLLALPPGVTSIHLSHPGYHPVLLENARVQLGKSTSLGTVTLRQMIHPMPEVVVSTERRNADVASTTYGSNLRPAEVDALPLQRNYKDMITMLPLSNLSYYDDGVNIAGATGYENKYFVDGVEVTDPLFQVLTTNLPYNFIREIEVKAGGYQADERSALGGALNVITYAGTNELHGSVFGFYTNNRFASNRRIGLSDPTQGGFSNFDVGFGLGGPVKRDKLWYYVAYNPTFTRRDVEVPGHGISVDQTVAHLLAAKLTWRASDRLNMTITMTGDPTRQNSVGRGVNVPPSSLGTTDSYFMKVVESNLSFSLHGMYAATEKILIEGSVARLNHYATGDPATDRGAPDPFFVDLQNNVWSGGPSSTWDAFRSATMAKLSATVSEGAHTMRAGAEFKMNEADNRYQYTEIDRYPDGHYEKYSGAGWQTVHDIIPSAFVQDKWQIARGFSIHAGIRWDGQEIFTSNGELGQKITLPLQPRVGFVYVPDDRGEHRIFGSFGRYAQEYALSTGMNAFSDQWYNYGFSYDHDPRVSPSGGTIMWALTGTTIAPGIDGLRGQYFDELNFGYQRQMDPTVNVGVEGLYRTLREAMEDVFVASNQTWTVGNPGRGELSDWPHPKREYLALIITLERNGDRHLNFLASYVLSRSYGNYGGLYDAAFRNPFPYNTSAFDFLENTRKYGTGLLSNDRTHVLKISGSYRFDFGLSTGLIFTAQSGTPMDEWAWNGTTLVLMAPRGTKGRTKAVWDVNARIAYELPLGPFPRSRLFLDLSHIASQRTAVFLQEYRGNIDANGQYTYVDSNHGVAYRFQPPMSARLGFEVSF